MDIVVGFIRTKEGWAALDRAVAEARMRNARLLVVHSTKGGHNEDVDEIVAYRKELEKVEERLAAEGLDYEVKEFARGQTPAEDLLQVAKEADADLVVIGIRRRSPVGKMILGSNAQDILLDADCAVLAVKASED